jgi:pimeloyl-ACP methyl ester carboxylesterase
MARPETPARQPVDNWPMPPVELACHEWTPRGAGGRGARVAVLVHGITGWHRTWWRLGPALAERGWRVVAVDQRGHGHSARIDGAATIDDLADDLEATIERWAVPPVDLLVGHSLGAVVSMRLGLRRPTIARRLVLEDPPSIDRSADEAFLASVRDGVRAARTSPEAEVRRELAENPRWLEEDARQNVEGRALVDAEGVVATMRRPRGFRVSAAAPALELPTLFLLADEKRSVLVGDARDELRRGLPPQATLVELDAGHTIHRDRFDEYLAALTEWSDQW